MQVIAKIEKWAQLPDVQTQNGMTSKAQVVLRTPGGRNAEGFVGTAFGIVAGKPLAEGTIVVADVRFYTHEYEGKVFQDVNIFDIMQRTLEDKDRLIEEQRPMAKLSVTPMITGKGQQHFLNLFCGEK